MKVFLRLDDQDQHGLGCDCGNCNANGKSYGVACLPLNDPEGDPLFREYACSEESAMHNARMQAEQQGHEVVPEPEEEE